MELNLKVHPVVFYWYRSVYGTTTILLKNNPVFARRLFFLLDCKPKTYHPSNSKFGNNFRLLKIQVNPYLRIGNKVINTEFRNQMDDRLQYFLSREIKDSFDSVFVHSVAAYCSARNLEPGCQKNGIVDFMDRHNIVEDQINYQTLKKKWDRSEQKKILFKKVKYKPVSCDGLSPVIL